MSTPVPFSRPPARIASIETAATVAGCSPRTIRRYIADGRLTGFRLGPRMIRVDLAEVEELLRPIPTTKSA